jgi:hypothetical protein
MRFAFIHSFILCTLCRNFFLLVRLLTLNLPWWLVLQ